MLPGDSALTAEAGVMPASHGEASSGSGGTSAGADAERLRAMAAEHFQFIWRSLRRLGVPPAAVDDATQKVFEIGTAKLGRIRPGSERSFLFNTAIRVAAGMRRHQATRRETTDSDLLENQVDPALTPDEATDWKRRRELLDDVLGAMPMDLRTVFVLFELEGLPTFEIALLLDIPAGTAASRLRRAREHFHDQAKRLRARSAFLGGGR